MPGVTGVGQLPTPSLHDLNGRSEYAGSNGNNTAFMADSTEASLGVPYAVSGDPLGGGDFLNIEDLLETTDWTSLMADWNEA